MAIERLPGYWLDEQLVLPVRGAVREAIERNLAGAPAGLLLGLLLGEKRRIPEEVREAFRGTGLAHALVVSGLHVGLVAGFFFFGFRFLRLSDRGSSAATIFCVFQTVRQWSLTVANAASALTMARGCWCLFCGIWASGGSMWWSLRIHITTISAV